MRSWARVAAVAAGSLALLAGAGFAAQAVVLPRPTGHELVAGAVVGRLLEVRSVRGEEWLDGRPVRDVCTEVVVRGRHGHRVRVELLVLGRRRLAVAASSLERVHAPRAELTAFMAAGCPLSVSEMIGNWLDRRVVPVRATRLHGRPVYALRVGWPARHLTLFVSRRSLTPVLARFTMRGEDGSGTVQAVRRHA